MTVARILELAAARGWPSIAFNRADVLQAGEAAWRKHTAHMNPQQQQRLVDALRAWGEVEP